MAAALVSEAFIDGEEEEQGEALPLPIGYRFVPGDHELILEYLMNKIMGFQLPTNIIKDIDFYDFDPHEFPTSDFKHGMKKNAAYYFTQTQQKYSKTDRIRRTSRYGYWKACGKERKINRGSGIVGFKKIFVFYWNNEVNWIKNKKSSWVMHEFRVNPSIAPTDQALDDSIKAKMQRCVICKIENKDWSREWPAESAANELKKLRKGQACNLKIDILNN
ncbi:NAC transcription factor 29-like [Durio zibethinus]|uniref:NAC transcription factor 29-like n=1 Tax=Durio zibethinus TaxID=66656 RepID=A0A6P5WV01_DURZI|nr:NAC transcription factor 29-like [Durio zibethinus]